MDPNAIKTPEFMGYIEEKKESKPQRNKVSDFGVVFDPNNRFFRRVQFVFWHILVT